MPLDNQWTIADKVVWDELETEHHPQCASAITRLRGCLREIEAPSQLIHGDSGGNILYADGRPPAIIDFSPYWRPAGFAVGVVVADFDQLLARAELRRVVEIDVAHRLCGWDILDELDAHFSLIDRIVELCRS